MLERYAIPFLGAKRLTAIRREDVRDWVAWLVDDAAQARRHADENAARFAAGAVALRAPGPLRDRTVARIVAVVKAASTAAMNDELRADNPAARIVLARRDQVAVPGEDEDSETTVKALTRAELAAVLLVLDGDRPHVRVRRAYVNGVMDRPKSKYGTRYVPLPHAVVVELRRHVAALQPVPADIEAKWGRLLFPSRSGTPVEQANLRRRTLKPAAEEAGVAWMGFHALRHTYASMMLAGGANVLQLSRALGHHSPSFTLNVYAHLLDDGMGAPLHLDGELAGSLAAATIEVEFVV